MTTALPTSLIVVSRGRPEPLRRCLTAVRQLDHPMMELVVVADAPGRAVLRAMGLAGQAKLVPFDDANISAARNRGIAAAAGEVAAFLDDDAVPEPTWLRRLAAAFEDPRVEAATGFVRGRNGISFQHRAGWVDRMARTRPLEVDPAVPSLHQGAPGSAVKTEGTNMAFRRETLASLGGFDPAFRFFLDETDLNMRLAALEFVVAVVPRAEVHHGFAASERRSGDRVPLDLREIGASTAVFLRKHAPDIDPAPRLAALRVDERKRLIRHMVSGALEPGDVGRLMAGLEAGITAGLAREIHRLLPIGGPDAPFLPLPGTGPRPGRVLAGWAWQRRRLARMAEAKAAAGAVVTVLRFSPGGRYHRVEYRPGGYWLQVGGLWGRSERDQPLLWPWRFATRLRAEISRAAPCRPIDSLLG